MSSSPRFPATALRAPLLAILTALALLAPAPDCQPGLATLGLPDGGRYCGQVKDGKLDGQGRLDWRPDPYYAGSFVDGLPSRDRGLERQAKFRDRAT